MQHLRLNMQHMMLNMKTTLKCDNSHERYNKSNQICNKDIKHETGKGGEHFGVFKIIKLRQITKYIKILSLNTTHHI